MRVSEIAQHRVAQQARQRVVLIYQLFGRLPSGAHDDNIVHRFGGVWASFGAVETKAIAAEAELGNVPPAIGEKLAHPNRPGDDFIPALGAVAFGIDLSIAREAEPRADALQRHQRVEVTRLRYGRAIVPQLCDPVAVVYIAELPVHDVPPVLDRENIAVSTDGRKSECPLAGR